MVKASTGLGKWTHRPLIDVSHHFPLAERCDSAVSFQQRQHLLVALRVLTAPLQQLDQGRVVIDGLLGILLQEVTFANTHKYSAVNGQFEAEPPQRQAHQLARRWMCSSKPALKSSMILCMLMFSTMLQNISMEGSSQEPVPKEGRTSEGCPPCKPLSRSEHR